MKNFEIDWDLVAAVAVIAGAILLGGWAASKLFKFCKLVMEESDVENDFFNNFYKEYEKMAREEQEKREARYEEFRQRFNGGGNNNNRSYQQAKKASDNMSIDEACRILGIEKKDLKGMKMADLKSIFRKKAQETHPDHGGSNEAFRMSKEAFDRCAAAA